MSVTLFHSSWQQSKRQSDDDDDYYYGVSTAAFAVHYAIVGGILLLIILYFVGGYFHARHRLAQGLPPLAYHRWMIRRRADPYQSQRYPYGYNAASNNPDGPGIEVYGPGAGNAEAYPLRRYPSPPPLYNTRDAPPPAYIQPEGSSKVAADQRYRDPAWRTSQNGTAVTAGAASAADMAVGDRQGDSSRTGADITAPAAAVQQRQMHD